MRKSFLSLLKKKLLKVYIADVIFFSLLLWFLAYARNRIFSYLLVIQQFAPSLADISSGISMDDPSSVAQLDALLQVLNPIISEAKFFIFIVIPVMLFLLWVLLQGFGWNVLRNDSLKRALDIRLYPSFALVSLPFFAVLVILLNNLLNFSDVSFNLNKSVTLIVLLFVVFYFTMVSCLVFGRPRFFSNLVRLSIKRAYVFFPVFLLVFLLFLVALILLFDVYVSVLALSMPSVISMVLLLFFILLFSCSKCLLEYLSE